MPDYVKQRKLTWYANIPVPEVLRERYGGRDKLEHSLKTRDFVVARALAQEQAARLRMEAEAARGNGRAAEELVRSEYWQTREDALAGRFKLLGAMQSAPGGILVPQDPIEAGIEDELEAIQDAGLERCADRLPEAEPILTPLEEARADGLEDALLVRRGRNPRNAERYDAPFSATAGDWMDEWKRKPNRKPSNTAAQYEASIRMFATWWGDKPLRQLKRQHAASYVSYLSQLTAGEARHGRAHNRNAERPPGPGLAPATIRRHVLTLSAIWKWARPRLELPADDPWEDLAPANRKSAKQTYLPWTIEELRALLVDNPPRRRELYELCFLALYSGLRISEAANLRWQDIVSKESVWLIRVLAERTKTQAGAREVPLHDQLGWLLARHPGPSDSAIWPELNPEGPGVSRGEDASRLFGAHKRSLGFTSRQKAFHSFRKNITERMEELGVPSDTWARLLGHEPGFTFGTYNPLGLTPARKKEIIDRLVYPGLHLPAPNDLYGCPAEPPQA